MRSFASELPEIVRAEGVHPLHDSGGIHCDLLAAPEVAIHGKALFCPFWC